MKPLEIVRAAGAEIARALNRSTARRTEFETVINAALAAIAASPMLGATIGRSRFRQFILPRRFPYSLMYADDPDAIRVYGFKHHRQNTAYFLRRARRRP